VRYGYQILGVQLCAFFWFLFINRSKFDLVIDQFHGIPFFTPLYIHQPILAVVQEVAQKVWLKNDLPFPINFLLGIAGLLSEPLIFFLFYRNIPFMTGSVSAQKDLVKMKIPLSHIVVVPHGVLLPSRLPKKTVTKKNVLIFLGAVAKDKGIEDALYAFSLLNRENRLRLWIVGKGGSEYVTSLLSLASRLNIINAVRFWGYVSEKEKFSLLSQSKLLINPSVHEGWGLVNIEANAVGTPVVGYKVGGLIDSVAQNISGVLVDDQTPASLATAIEKILSNKKEYNRLRKGSLLWSKKFSWNNSIKQSLLLLKSIAKIKN
jgi:glycosyltransferase involved in cell wall biosynthesis